MTTRLLEAFNVLDGYSKRVLERHAKNNFQLSVPRHCFAKVKRSSGPVLDYAFDFHSPRKSIYKPKSTTEQTSGDQCQLHKRIPKSATPATNMKGSSSIRSVEVFSTRINIHPFTSSERSACVTSPSNVQSSAGNSLCQDQEGKGTGFMITSLKRPKTLETYRQTSPRMKWSKEIEKVPSLHALNKANSKVSVDSNIGYTDTSHWCSSSFNNVDGQFKHTDSVGIMDTQLHHRTFAKSGTSMSQKTKTGDNSEKEFTQEHVSPFAEEAVFEPVPLCFEDELESKNVKVLTPRPASVYKALPIVSETYPVEYTYQQHQYEPFSSPGFHSLDPPEPSNQDPSVKKSTVHSAIINITKSIQADSIIHSQTERQRGEAFKCLRSSPEPRLSTKRISTYHVNLHVLSANGNVVRSSDLGWVPLHKHDESLSVPINKGPSTPLVLPRKKVLSFAGLGPVVNGLNPACGPEEIDPPCSKPQHDMPKRMLSSRCYTSDIQSTATNLTNKMDFLYISKPVKYIQNGMKGFVTKRQTYKKDWNNDATEMCINIMMSKVECETNGMQFSTQTNEVTCYATNPLKDTLVTEHSDTQTLSKLSSTLNRLQTIKIPTAESVN